MTEIRLALVTLGSNVDAAANLPLAAARLAALGRVSRISQVYETPAVGPSGQPTFLNAAIALETTLARAELKKALAGIESDLGRVRDDNRYAPRTIDLDISLWVDDTGVSHPDPDLLDRAYLAKVLAEVGEDLHHPDNDEALRDIAARMGMDERWRPRPEIQQAMLDAVSRGSSPAAASAGLGQSPNSKRRSSKR